MSICSRLRILPDETVDTQTILDWYKMETAHLEEQVGKRNAGHVYKDPLYIYDGAIRFLMRRYGFKTFKKRPGFVDFWK